MLGGWGDFGGMLWVPAGSFRPNVSKPWTAGCGVAVRDQGHMGMLPYEP